MFTCCASASTSSACASDDARVVELALRHRERDRRTGGDPVDHGAHGLVEVGDRHHRVDEPELEGLGAAQHLRGEGQLLRPVEADALAQQPRRPEVEAEPALGEDRREPGPVRAPREVGGQGEPEAGAHTDTVDLGDHRHRARVDGQDDLGEHTQRVELRRRHGDAVTTTFRATTTSAEVGAGAELTARAGQQHRARAGEARPPGRWRRARPTCRRCRRSSRPGGRSSPSSRGRRVRRGSSGTGWAASLYLLSGHTRSATR